MLGSLHQWSSVRYRVRRGVRRPASRSVASLPIECRDGNYEGTITADFREYIFHGTIKWPMSYERSAEKCGREGSGHVARVVHHCGEIYYSPERDWLPGLHPPSKLRHSISVVWSTLLMGSENGPPLSPFEKFVEILNMRFFRRYSREKCARFMTRFTRVAGDRTFAIHTAAFI